MRRGRPLRFLGIVIGGWVALRIVALWPSDVVAIASATDDAAPMAALVGRVATAMRHAAPSTQPISIRRDVAPIPSIAPRLAAVKSPTAIAYGLAVSPNQPQVRQFATGRSTAPGLAIRPLPPVAAHGSRLAGSAWLIARGGSNGTLLGGQLGGSQAGARLTFALDAQRRVALSARIATPLSGRGREAAVGLDWRPTRLPVHVIAEQRLSLDGGRGGPTLMLVAGTGPAKVAPGVWLESYAQAGVIGRDGAEGFGDGAIRATHRVPVRGRLRLDLGLGAWGAVQRGAQRLDVGPTIGIALPVAAHTVRVSLDYRARIGGDASPGSGPALSLGTDF